MRCQNLPNLDFLQLLTKKVNKLINIHVERIFRNKVDIDLNRFWDIDIN